LKLGRFLFHFLPEGADRFAIARQMNLLITPGEVKAPDENGPGKGQRDDEDGPGGERRPSFGLHVWNRLNHDFGKPLGIYGGGPKKGEPDAAVILLAAYSSIFRWADGAK
jgi:hypothetical protein